MKIPPQRQGPRKWPAGELFSDLFSDSFIATHALSTQCSTPASTFFFASSMSRRLRERDLERFRRLGIDPQASAAHSWHFSGQKLRLGGDALGADPTYLLYLPSRPRGGLRRIDFGAWPRAAVSPRQIPPESTCKPLLHTRGISRASVHVCHLRVPSFSQIAAGRAAGRSRGSYASV